MVGLEQQAMKLNSSVAKGQKADFENTQLFQDLYSFYGKFGINPNSKAAKGIKDYLMVLDSPIRLYKNYSKINQNQVNAISAIANSSSSDVDNEDEDD